MGTSSSATMALRSSGSENTDFRLRDKHDLSRLSETLRLTTAAPLDGRIATTARTSLDTSNLARL